MADPVSLVSLVTGATDLMKEAWKLVEKGVKYESTVQEFEKMEMQLRPMFEEIEELARRMNLPDAEIENLKNTISEMREALLRYSKLECWQCCLKPCYKDKLDKADKAIKNFISNDLVVLTSMNVMHIRWNIEAGVPTGTRYQQPALSIDMEALIFEDFMMGLNTSLM